MSRKAFLVQVELEVQAVTCPGVWLCSNGKVSLQIYMLDSCVQTASYKPVFPIQCGEHFVFYKTFYANHRLNDLQRELHDQWLYIEFVQWQSCEVGNVLASFQTTLDELLYPSSHKGSIPGIDIDLLMEPSKTFPGTIAPKIEVSTKTTIEETVCVCDKPSSSTVIVNPKVLMSAPFRKTRPSASRKVCHSIAFSRRKYVFPQRRGRPPFRYKKADDDLILRKPQADLEPIQRPSRSLERGVIGVNQPIRGRRPPAKQCGDCPCTVKVCDCGSGHRENNCPVCAKYRGYFTASSAPSSPPHLPKRFPPEVQVRSTLFDSNKAEKGPRIGRRCPCCRPLPLRKDQKSDSDYDSDPSDSEAANKPCCCRNKEPKKPSLAEKLHAKLTKTLSSVPRSVDYEDLECEACSCPIKNPGDARKSRAELYKDLQKFYGTLYEKARNQCRLCVSD